jgi:hypothetical protein
MVRIEKKAAVLALFLLTAGCATGVDYDVLGQRMGSGDCSVATSYLDEKKDSYGANKKLLFFMDAAAVNMYCGRYESSNAYLHEADRLAQDLWTRSITKEAAAFILNDYTTPYAGEDFERALINMFSALNYSVIGDYDEALVECRRLNTKLTELNDRYREKNVYREDAFGRYLSGMVYEADGVDRLENIDSAFIDYDRAVDVYRDYAKKYGTPVPRALAEDYMRIAQAADRLGEAKRKLGRRNRIKWISHKDARRLGKVVFIHLNGSAPVKDEDRLIIATKGGPVTLAFPKYVVKRPRCRTTEVVAESPARTFSAGAELVEDITSIATQNLEDRKGRVIAKTIARAVVKQAAINAASNQIKNEGARQLTKLGLNLLNILVERADTRSWRTLPAEIYMARMFVPEGRYKVYAKRCGFNRAEVETVDVKAGETKFVLLDTVF